MTRWIFAFALALGGLTVMTPVPAQAEVREMCLTQCSIIGSVQIEQAGKDGIHTDHRYKFESNCEIWTDGSFQHKYFNTEAQYSPLSQLGTEKIFSAGGHDLLFEWSFRCNGDPYRGSGRCTETGLIDYGIRTVGEKWSACYDIPPPLLHNSRDAKIVNALVAKKTADPPAPIIVSPHDGEEMPHFGLQTVEVKHPPREGWFVNYTFPGRVELNWFYLGPDGQSIPQQRGGAILPHEISGVSESPRNRTFEAYRLEEGLWSVHAYFPSATKLWHKYESRVSFWVGDRVDVDLPAPTIQMPMEGAQNAADPVKAYVNFEDQEFVSRMRRGGLLNRNVLKLESEWMTLDPEKMKWRWGGIVFGEVPHGKIFELWRAGEGKFRFRVRHKRKVDGPGYPWSAWRTYYVGELGEEIRSAQRRSLLKAGIGGKTDSAPGPGGQVGTEVIQGGAQAATSLQRIPRLLSPHAGQQFSGYVTVKLQPGKGSPAVGLRIEVHKAGRWRQLHGRGLPQPAPPGQPIRLNRSLFGNSERARISVIMPNGSSGPPTEFRLSRLRQLPMVSLPKPPDAKKVKTDALKPVIPSPPDNAKKVKPSVLKPASPSPPDDGKKTIKGFPR